MQKRSKTKMRHFPPKVLPSNQKKKALGESPSTTKTVDRLANISLPNEIINEIISRLPVKSILRFRSVSKSWLSHISDPSFTKLHFTRATLAHRTGLFISTYDKSTRKRHFLSAARDAESVTHLMTLDDACSIDVTTESQHLNGLVFYTCIKCCYKHNFNFVFNPSTHKVFQLPDHAPLTNCNHKYMHICYLFGFDESRNEHKILHITELDFGSIEPASKTTKEIMIFSLSSYSWRKIYAEPPIGFRWDHLHYDTKRSICVNSVVHLLLRGSFDILAFDLKTEKFSIIRTPKDVLPREMSKMHIRNREVLLKRNKPCIISVSGCIGVLCHDRVVESNEMHIWTLKDYENHVWVRETITFPKPWMKLDCPFPLDVGNTDGIIFSSTKVSRNAVRLPIYNVKSRCFKSLQLSLGHQFLCPEIVQVDQIKSFVESIMPL